MATYSKMETVRPIERVLVCGGRDYGEAEHVWQVLDGIHAKSPIACIIQGGAGGADLLARNWAIRRSVALRTYWADWPKYGRRAGPIRNKMMLDQGRPDLVIAFPGGRGTDDMLRRAKAAGVDWMQCSREKVA